MSMMCKVIYENLFYGPLASANLHLQLADQSNHFGRTLSEEIAKGILVKLKNSYILVDFVVIDMGSSLENPIILGEPFLRTANDRIYVGLRRVQFQIRGRTKDSILELLAYLVLLMNR